MAHALPLVTRKHRDSALYAGTLVLFVCVAYLTLSDVDWSAFTSTLSYAGVAGNLAIGLTFFVSQGALLAYMLRRRHGIALSAPDVVALPMMMYLWTYLLPVKGGLLFQMLFVRLKYGLALTSGFALGIGIFVLGVALSGASGLLLTPFVEGQTGLLRLVFAALLSVPPLLCLLAALLRRSRVDQHRLLGPVKRFAIEIFDHLALYLDDLSFLLGCVTVLSLQILVQAAWFQQSAMLLGISGSFAEMLLVTLILRIAYLVRPLPGNLGVQEILTGMVFGLAGLGLQDGLMVALLMRMASIALAGSIGALALYANLEHLGLRSFKQLFRDLRTPTETLRDAR